MEDLVYHNQAEFDGSSQQSRFENDTAFTQKARRVYGMPTVRIS